MLSQTAEYALEAMIWLGAQGPAPQTTRQIADAIGLPAGYLAKVMQTLQRAGLVQAQRGVGGGYSLSRSSDRISLLEVVNVVDPIPRASHAAPTAADAKRVLAPLLERLDGTVDHVEDVLGRSTIAELNASIDASPAAAT